MFKYFLEKKNFTKYEFLKHFHNYIDYYMLTKECTKKKNKCIKMYLCFFKLFMVELTNIVEKLYYFKLALLVSGFKCVQKLKIKFVGTIL